MILFIGNVNILVVICTLFLMDLKEFNFYLENTIVCNSTFKIVVFLTWNDAEYLVLSSSYIPQRGVIHSFERREMITEYGCFSFLAYPFLICTFFIDMKLIPCDATVSFDVFFFLFISPFHNDALLMLDHLFEWDNSLFTMPYNKVLIKSGTKLVLTTIWSISGYVISCYMSCFLFIVLVNSTTLMVLTQIQTYYWSNLFQAFVIMIS